MSFKEIEQEALALSEAERAILVATLLETLPAPETDVSDRDALQRDTDLEAGVVQPISHDEFVRRVRSERRG